MTEGHEVVCSHSAQGLTFRPGLKINALRKVMKGHGSKPLG